MLKKLRIIFGLLFLVALCVGLSACKSAGPFDKYDVVVYYNANGGVFGGMKNTMLVDGFCFSDYEADEDGYYHIKLLDPASPLRPQPSKRTLNKTGNFNVGWYKKRVSVTDEEGNLLDNRNRPLVAAGDKGVYYVSGTENSSEPVVSEPAYTYDDKWDFENGEIVCKAEDGKQSITLYAGWVPYFYFDYYWEVDGEWVKYGETYFNYENIMNDDADYFDRNTIWVPDWNEGIMDHNHSYNKGTYTFPQMEGYTFAGAYTDEGCTQKIDDSFVHEGTVDLEHATANWLQNIYVKFDKGVQYRISKAEQLANNVRTDGLYTIYDDLDFTGLSQGWPKAFVTGTFTGKFVAAEGTVTITGATAEFSSDTAIYGGLFGRVGDGAEIKGIEFADAKLKIASTSRRDCYFGLFSGEISEQATVENITVGGSVWLGQISSSSTCSVNMLVHGVNKGGVTASADGIELYAYGRNLSMYYLFAVDFTATTIDANGDVNIVFAKGIEATQQAEEDKYIETWRQ